VLVGLDDAVQSLLEQPGPELAALVPPVAGESGDAAPT
jgi:hypothetical protein